MPPKKEVKAKPKGASKGKKIQYTVTPLDIDGDGIADGDVITKYKDGVVETSKYVPLKKLKNEMKKAVTEVSKSTTESQKPKPQSQKQVVYKNMPQDIQQSNNTVFVSDQTGFGQYVKQGAGFAVGSLAVDAAVNAISGLFSGEE
jgi:hypothetical protein